MNKPRESAPNVCSNCKARKRKCSKELPSCSLCTKLILQCNYRYESTARPSVPNEVHLGSPAAACADPSNSRSSTGIPTFPQLSTALETCNYVLDILIGLGESIPAITSTYFRTIDVWFPVISPQIVQKGFQNIRTDPSAELGALLMCMYVITRLPGSGGSDAMKSSIYTQAKLLHFSQVSTGKPSIEIVQAGALLALYEQGHGMIDAAQMSIATTSRLGFRMVTTNKKAGLDVFDTDLGNLWLGIVMLDRYMSLGAEPNEIFLSTGLQMDRALDVGIPVDPEAIFCDETRGQTPTPSGLFASIPPTRLGPFYRAAEASKLLGRVLEIVSRPSILKAENKNNEFETLDMDLQNLALSLFKQATNGWEECCAAIGLCFSGLLTLHANGPEKPSDHPERLMAIRSAVKIVIDISDRFDADRAHIDLTALALPATFCVYQAACLYIQTSEDEFLGQQWKSNMQCLRRTLGHFAKRWDIGNRFLEYIDRAIASKTEGRYIAQYPQAP